jgi:hypothetical protein
LAGGVAGAYFGEPYVGNNPDATLVVITVLTVFGGFLVAIIGVLGDPGMMPRGSWRVIELQRDNIENRLIRYIWLFYIYLIGIAFLFVGVLLHKTEGLPVAYKVWTDRLSLFFGVTAFLLTLALPRSLLNLQLRKMDAEIERRRGATGISSEDPTNGPD